MSNVFVIVYGDVCDTGIRQLAVTGRTPFQSASVDIFLLSTKRRLGDVMYLRIWHDNSGTSLLHM